MTIDDNLSAFGWTREEIAQKIITRYDTDKRSAILSGSVIEGLSNGDSDVDVLLIGANESFVPRATIQEGSIMDAMGSQAGRLQVEQCSLERLDSIVEKIKHMLDKSRNEAVLISVPDRRIAHRMLTGIPIINVGLADEFRRKLSISELAFYCLMANMDEAEGALRDAVGELDAGRPLSASRMLQMSSGFLLMSCLNSIGETNHNTKWVVRLCERHREKVDPENIELLMSNLFLDRASAVNKRQVQEKIKRTWRVCESIKAKAPEYFQSNGYGIE